MKSEALETTEALCADGKTAPRVSLADIEANIVGEYYAPLSHAFPDDSIPASFCIVTLCALHLRNGFTILGKSAPASPENFNAELGRKLAYENAVDQLWPLMGYALREKLASGQ